MARRAEIASFEIEHSGCWTSTTDKYDVKIKTLRQEFISPHIFRASIAIIGEDLRRFISDMRRSKYIVELSLSFSRTYSFNGDRIWLALMDFSSLREGSISDLVYRIGGLILDQEVGGGVERWKILIPRSSRAVRKYLEESLRNMGRLLKISFSEAGVAMFNPDPRTLLSDNERKAVELALSTGLLDYPKRARVADVAKLMGISPATFIYHLRKGEKKLLSIALERWSS